MLTAIVKPSRLEGRIEIPPSKSHSLRAILLASMARGSSTVRGILDSPDIAAMITACRDMGAQIERNGNDLTITGVAGKPTPPVLINAGNSGQVLRFAAIMAALSEGEFVLDGDHSIRTSRPVRPLMDGLNQLGGICVSRAGNDRAPLLIRGPIGPGSIGIEGADSQPVSGFLMAAGFMDGTTTIQVDNPGETPWIELTLDWLDRLLIPYTVNADYTRYSVTGHIPNGFDYRVPGDLSSVAFPVVGALVSGGRVEIGNVDLSDKQGDRKILPILAGLGADIQTNPKGRAIEVRSAGPLDGADIDINDLIDALPILAVAGCHTRQPLGLNNCEIARAKECDRLSVARHELAKMGADIDEHQNRLVIRPSHLTGAEVDSHADHRMAMALAIAGLGATGETRITGAEVVAKSYPDFWDHLQALGADVSLMQDKRGEAE